jgi:hypothetical protein
MATQPEAKSGAISIALIASPIHTAIVIALGVANAVRGVWFAGRVRAGLLPDRPTLYLRTILFECVMLSVVLAGLKLRGTPLQVVLGKRWRTAGEMFRDVGIGIALWFAALILSSLLSGHNSSADGSIRISDSADDGRIPVVGGAGDHCRNQRRGSVSWILPATIRCADA